jgi:hypothetical protein
MLIVYRIFHTGSTSHVHHYHPDCRLPRLHQRQLVRCVICLVLPVSTHRSRYNHKLKIDKTSQRHRPRPRSLHHLEAPQRHQNRSTSRHPARRSPRTRSARPRRSEESAQVEEVCGLFVGLIVSFIGRCGGLLQHGLGTRRCAHTTSQFFQRLRATHLSWSGAFLVRGRIFPSILACAAHHLSPWRTASVAGVRFRPACQ